MKAYLMHEEEDGDIEQWQQPNELLDENGQVQLVGNEELAQLGVLYKNLGPQDELYDQQLDQFALEHNYKNRDEISINPAKMQSAVIYEQKLKIFYTEHIHADDEVRFIKAGSGYFDVRNRQDQWIRMHVAKGDLIVLPAGIFHRFITDQLNNITAVRLFKDEPKWTPIDRSADVGQHPARQEYLKTFTA